MSKRITLPISGKIDHIKEKVQEDLGIEMTYAQIVDFLIHYYVSKTAQPKTQWREIK